MNLVRFGVDGPLNGTPVRMNDGRHCVISFARFVAEPCEDEPNTMMVFANTELQLGRAAATG